MRFFNSIYPILAANNRGISYKINVGEDIAKKMFEGPAFEDSSHLVPNAEQIENHQIYLKKLYQQNPEFKKVCDNLFKHFNNPKVTSIALSFSQPTNPESNRNVFFFPVLTATALFSGIGIKPFYNDKGFPLFAVTDKESTGPILGHQDSMYFNPNDKEPSLIKYLMLVNGFSKSEAITWFKDSVDILNELKEKQPLSYEILKNTLVNANSRNQDDIGYKTPFKIIGENDELNFVSGFLYSPSSDLPSNTKVQFNKAVNDLKYIVNSKSNRHEFVLNQNRDQILLLKNRMGVHGRDQVGEDDERSVIAISMEPSTSIQVSNKSDNKSEASKTK